MATWAKENIIIPRANSGDGSLDDKTGETIQVMEVGGTYPTDAISCNPGSGTASRYMPTQDLDTTKEYYAYADGNIFWRFAGPDVAQPIVDVT